MRWAMQSSAFLNLGQGGRLPFYHYRAPSIRSQVAIVSFCRPPVLPTYIACGGGGKRSRIARFLFLVERAI